jgi:hypothetical protein
MEENAGKENITSQLHLELKKYGQLSQHLLYRTGHPRLSFKVRLPERLSRSHSKD